MWGTVHPPQILSPENGSCRTVEETFIRKRRKPEWPSTTTNLQTLWRTPVYIVSDCKCCILYFCFLVTCRPGWNRTTFKILEPSSGTVIVRSNCKTAERTAMTGLRKQEDFSISGNSDWSEPFLLGVNTVGPADAPSVSPSACHDSLRVHRKPKESTE